MCYTGILFNVCRGCYDVVVWVARQPSGVKNCYMSARYIYQFKYIKWKKYVQTVMHFTHFIIPVYVTKGKQTFLWAIWFKLR